MAELSINLLGPLEIRGGGKSLRPLRSIKAEALLVYLLTEQARNGRETFQREQLMTLLWPDMPETSARQNLRQTLYLLRKAVPAVGPPGQEATPLVLSDRQTVQLNPQATYELDLARFLQLWEQSNAAALEKTIAIYRGPFLSDFYLEDSNDFESWAAAHRGDLQRLAGEVLAQLVENAWQQNRPAKVEVLARRWAALDDLAEPPQQALVQALDRQGRRTAATRHYQEYALRLEEALGVEPAVALADLLAASAETVTVAPPAAPPVTPVAPLPTFLTPFVGREEELARLDAYLDRPEVRLVTIVGPGGAGKTRLAVEAVRAREGAFRDGLFFISLADLESSAQLATALAGTLGMSMRDPTSVRRQLLAYLRPRHCLLVLDNFERLLPGRELLLEILREAPAVRLLVTSQEQLSVAGEWLLQLGGLPLFAADPEAEQSPAVRLLVQSAQRVRQDFALTPENQTHLLHICRLLQGIPLGIELAAFWLRHLDSATLAQEIEQNIGFLRSTLQNLPARHRSLRAIFNYTWQRLAEAERELLRTLAVFQGGFTLPAARQVAGASLVELAALADKSLLQSPAASAQNRYQMHTYLRQFIVEQLEADEEQANAARARHAAFFAEWLVRQELGLQAAQLPHALATVTAEIDNVRAAWRHAAGLRDAAPAPPLLEQMVQPLLLFYEVRGWFQEGEAQFRLAAEQPLPPSTRALILAVWGWFGFRGGTYERAYALLEESLELSKDPRVQMFSLSTQALLLTAGGRFDEAEAKGEASLEAGRALEAQVFKAFALHNLGTVARVQEQYEVARGHYEESRILFQAVGNAYGAAFALINLGNVQMQLGDAAAAEATFREGLALCEHAGYRYGQSVALRSLALALLASGQADAARPPAQESLRLAEAMADTEGMAWAQMALARVSAERGRLPLALHNYGRAQTIFQALGHSLGQAEVASCLAEIALTRGEYERASELVQHSLNLYQRLGQREGQAVAHSLLARLAVATGRAGAARMEVEQAEALVQGLEAQAAVEALRVAQEQVREAESS